MPLDDLSHVDGLADSLNPHLDLVERPSCEPPFQEDPLNVVHQRIDDVAGDGAGEVADHLAMAESKSLRRFAASPRRARQAISYRRLKTL